MVQQATVAPQHDAAGKPAACGGGHSLPQSISHDKETKGFSRRFSGYMGERAVPVEIERKFKVTDDGWRAMVRETREIADHLIARFENENGKARVRICEDTPILTIKGPKRGFSRHEHHIQLHDADAKSLIETFSDSVPLTKIRHEVEYVGFIWQVDEYSGPLSGLVTCEIELPSEDAAFARPPWVGEEITGDERYSASMLADKLNGRRG